MEEFNGMRADGSDKDSGKGGLMYFGPDGTMFEDTAKKLHRKTVSFLIDHAKMYRKIQI